jgi:hypothetical protein
MAIAAVDFIVIVVILTVISYSFERHHSSPADVINNFNPQTIAARN